MTSTDGHAKTWVPDEMLRVAVAAYARTVVAAEMRGEPSTDGHAAALREALYAGFMFANRFTVRMEAGYTNDAAAASTVRELLDGYESQEG